MSEHQQDNNVLDDVERPEGEQAERREVRVERHAVEVLVRPVRPPAQDEGGEA